MTSQSRLPAWLIPPLAALIARQKRGAPPKPDPEALILEPPAEREGPALLLEGAPNFRDLGGYRTTDGRRVRVGQVYRSGALSELTETDLERLAALGIHQVFDLRTPEEVARNPDRLPDGVRYVPLPLPTEGSSFSRIVELIANLRRLDQLLLRGYTRVMIDSNARFFGDLLRRLAHDEQALPAVIHCTAGKDRAGMAAALLLAALGVPDETIVADYSLSSRHYALFHRLVSEQIAPLAPAGLTADDLHGLLVANPEVMRSALAHLRGRYGSIEAYLLKHAGLDAAALERLRERLLEP
jgi:protein-tyrosine phosphatase